MKIGLTALLLLCLTNISFSQIIIGEKLISLADKPEHVIPDYLRKTGWEYCGIDSANSKDFGVNIVWRYKYDSVRKSAEDMIIFTYKKVGVDSVLWISKEVTKMEYYRMVRTMHHLDFNEQKRTHPQQEMYGKKSVQVEFIHYAREKGNYQLNIYKTLP